jgi:transcriptional regulator with XRE-family HTH domain
MSVASSSNVQALRQALGARLREVRLEAGLSARELAQRMGRHPSKVSRIEGGTATPSPADIRSWCEHTQAEDREQELIDALRTLEGMYVEWGRIERTGRRQLQESIHGLFHKTRKFKAYSSWLIPGPLQTVEYTRTLMNLTAAKRGFPNDTEDMLQIRADRNRVLYKGDHTFAILIEETLLRVGVGGPEVMAGQLGHLITASTLPSVGLGIVPMGTSRTSWPVEDFWILDDQRVLVELVSGHLSLTQQRDVELYLQQFADLNEHAVYGPAARALIANAISSIG